MAGCNIFHYAPLDRDPYPTPLQFHTINPSDTVGPSSPSPHGTGLSNRRKASPKAVNPPAERSRRAPQRKVTRETGTNVNPKDESLGFASLNQQPELQNAMRALIVAIRDSDFVKNNQLEPRFGTPAADDVLTAASYEANALPPDEILRGYGTRGKSIYYIFIEDDYKCLWCGNEQQKDKPLRAVRHFRAIHLGHRPFRCEDIHDGTKWWV